MGSASRVLVTHDFMETYGGAERVTAAIAAEFPSASVIALLGRPGVAERMGIHDRFTSLVPPRPWLLDNYRLLAPAWGPLADRARLPEADVVVSSSYAYAHRLRTTNDAPIVCYCHSPLRFAWSMTDSYRDRWAGGALSGQAFGLVGASARRADRRASTRVASYLTQSAYTADQISRFYGRDAEVVGAPVDCDRFCPSASEATEDFFLLCGRLIEPYKRVGVAVEAFRRLGRRLVVAGDGPAFDELRAVAPTNVEFVGPLADADLISLMRRCQAVVFPSRDDFGLVPVEVMACGRPVLAYAGGGARHTVLPGVTGELFAEQTPEAIVAAVEAFEPEAYDPAAIRAHAMRWDTRAFRARLAEAVERVLADRAALG